MALILEKKVKLKNSFEINVREAEIKDAKNILAAFVDIAKHSPYILTTYEEVLKKTIEDEEKQIKSYVDKPGSAFIIAEHNSKIIGLADIGVYKSIKMKHRAALGISVVLDYRGLGLGKFLMQAMIDFIKTIDGVKILELDVMNLNTHAVNMYLGLGFKEIFRYPNAYKMTDGKVADNIRMAIEL